MAIESASKTSHAPQRSISMAVVGLAIVLGLTLLPTASYAAALPLIKQEWMLTSAEAGFVFSAYQAGYVAATLLLLPLTDRVDPRWVLAASTLLSAAGNALFPLLAGDLLSGGALRFVAGITLVGVYMPGLRIIAEMFPPERRGGPVGIYVAAFYIGTSLSVLLTGLLLPLGWRNAYLITATIAILAPIVGWLTLRHRVTAPTSKGSGRLDLTVLANRPVLLTVTAYSAHTFELYSARGWIAPFLAAALAAQGYAATSAASLGATISGTAFVLGSLGVLGAGFVSDRLGRTLTATLVLAGSGLCSLSIGWMMALPIWALFAMSLLYGFMIGPDSPIYSTAITELAPAGKLGSTMAVQSFWGFLASVMGPIALGAVLDLGGPVWGWGLGFSLSGVVAVMGVVALLALRRHPASLGLANGRR